MSDLFVDEIDIENFKSSIKNNEEVDPNTLERICQAATLGVEAQGILSDMRPFLTKIWFGLKHPTEESAVVQSILMRLDNHCCSWFSNKAIFQNTEKQ
jgi:hypothetical protein